MLALRKKEGYFTNYAQWFQYHSVLPQKDMDKRACEGAPQIKWRSNVPLRQTVVILQTWATWWRILRTNCAQVLILCMYKKLDQSLNRLGIHSSKETI
mmetsp:Transcript_61093/g.180720  ORF Transcript_61093/g.180720 Transcript_61093/m.180720 type:complete len:98 (+) Transcript_61093:796-1089(+)